MATIRGTVITLELETDVKKNGGGSYKGWELVYKSQDGEVRSIAKPVQGLRFGTLKAQLQALGAGDQFTLTHEKNAQGFNDVKTISKGWDVGIASPSTSSPATGSGNAQAGAKATAYQASSYPTKDEREATQNHIIRQSSLAQAVATLAIAGKPVKPADVLVVAEEFVDWVKFKPTGAQALLEMENDFPD